MPPRTPLQRLIGTRGDDNHQWFGFTLSLLVAAAAVAVNVVNLSTNGFQPHDPDILPLKHIGVYSVRVQVGGQWMWIQLDTGSSEFAVAPWWNPSSTPIPYCANPPCNNSLFAADPPPAVYASALTILESYSIGNWSGAAVQTSVIFGSLKSSDILVWVIWSTFGGLFNEAANIDGIMGLAYDSYVCDQYYVNQNQFDNVTCGSTNYGQMCATECNQCIATACANVETCGQFCTNAVNQLGQQVGRMKPLPTQLGMDMFGMYLCAGSEGSKFVVQNPLQKYGLYTGSVQWTPVTLLNAYNVETIDIFLQGAPPLTVNGTNATTFLAQGAWQHESLTYVGYNFPSNFDSGTSGLGVWNTYVIFALVEMLVQQGFDVPIEYCTSASQLSRPLYEWPSIGLVFKGGAVLYVPATSYLNSQQIVEGQGFVECNDGEYAWNIGMAGNNRGATLGNGVMWPYYMIFDRAGGRVGWAPKAEACPNTQ